MVDLPTGFWRDGVHQHRAELRPLTGGDEIAWLEMPAAWPRVQRMTALLSRGITRLGDQAPPSMGAVATLTVGDREALLLALRGLTFGNRMDCVLQCPSCAERLDLELHVDDLLLPPYEQPQPWRALTVDANDQSFSMRLRVPNGADQLAIATLAAADPAAAAQALLARCVTDLRRGDELLDSIPALLQGPVAEAMAEIDPQAELNIQMTCPNCGAGFTSLFDTAAYLGQEIEDRADAIFREVHALALYYHWSESDILDMSYRRRQRYLQLLDESLSGERYL